MKKKKFTIIELLVVISIIAILASMLLPALSKAKDMAKKAQCQSNMKQQFLGVGNYLADWDGYIPAKITLPQFSNFLRHLTGYANSGLDYIHVKPYFDTPYNLGKKSILDCPGIDLHMTTITGAQHTSSFEYLFDMIPRAGVDLLTVSNKPLIKMSKPSLQSMIMDSAGKGGYFLQWSLITAPNDTVLAHNNGINILYWDGHTGWKKYNELPIVAGDIFWNEW